MKRAVQIVVLVVVVALSISACELHFRTGAKPSATSPSSTEIPQDQRAGQFFNSITDKDFTSIADAEQAGGYHIPQPGSSYPRAFNLTTLRWFRGDRRPTSESQYSYVPMAPTSIGVTVGPAYDWDEKDGTSGEQVLSYGTPTAIGPWDGWFTDHQGAFVFRFHCGAVDNVAVWCIARTTNAIGRDAFDAFVASIR
jgi:hypothetical protein